MIYGVKFCIEMCFFELSLVGRDIALYGQKPRFELRILHLFTFKVDFLARLLKKKKIQ
jgi:hypothetical protein